eukprot:1057863_1
MAESQKDSVKAILPKLKEIGETLVCGLCKFHRVGGGDDDDDDECVDGTDAESEQTDNNEQDDTTTNVQMGETNVVLYGRSKRVDQRLQKIKKKYIGVLIAQLRRKVTLAKKIKLFKFLSPNYITKCCTELDADFDITAWTLASKTD